ncbi:Zinc finger protein MAGPIE [Apostasia shenzhenica]|uniref:Protein EARLY HEADING DATE 2 n=1 Tax=Apostasia shenzhenica TaxID=1088818 RepID=A0A2I0AFR9_9ASPA|nr:Zinc finger protein MAGPIE [Apostasia shenzhenica]
MVDGTEAIILNNSLPPNRPAAKKRRNLPGTPDPKAEVIALSPKTLMATNRFVCEICGKGFQRDQNLQLHRRGHNLPWKLRQRSGEEPRKRVYVCPEKSCIHHNPSRALGDLTGIKKHFCRKHGEKKWKCDKCSKRYAVQSDWKAHSKVCGTREYRCDCGTLFSRRDSFITHRAFCDALAEEAARITAASNFNASSMADLINYPACFTDQSLPPRSSTLAQMQPLIQAAAGDSSPAEVMAPALSLWMRGQETREPLAVPSLSPLEAQLSWIYSSKISSLPICTVPMKESGSENLSPQALASLSSSLGVVAEKRQSPAVNMSATALLQKAAQMGVVSSHRPSLLVSFDMRSSSRELFSLNQQAGLPAVSLGGRVLSPTGQFNLQNYEVGEGRRAGTHGEGITRDFLGVGIQPLSSSVNGWI